MSAPRRTRKQAKLARLTEYFPAAPSAPGRAQRNNNGGGKPLPHSPHESEHEDLRRRRTSPSIRSSPSSAGSPAAFSGNSDNQVGLFPGSSITESLLPPGLTGKSGAIFTSCIPQDHTTHSAGSEARAGPDITQDSEDRSDKPVTEGILKSLLCDFHTSLINNMQTLLMPLQKEINDLGDRTSHMENKFGQFAKTLNALIDSNNDKEDELEAIRNKLIDMEDRSRRQNIRFRGIPESVKPDSLLDFLSDMFALLLPGHSQLELSMDRAHRIPKPRYLAPEIPRDVLARITFYNTKEKLLQAMRSNPALPERFRPVSMFSDLSAATLAKRREFQGVTKSLRERGLPYRWGFPVKLIVTYNGSKHVLTSPEDAISTLSRWNIPISDGRKPAGHKSPPAKTDEEWSRIGPEEVDPA